MDNYPAFKFVTREGGVVSGGAVVVNVKSFDVVVFPRPSFDMTR